jgi:ubiquitin-like-conjugating enzyme ATG10
MALHDNIGNHPFLTEEEFSLACHLLDQKYIAATLGQERRAFRLRLQHSLLNDSVSICITKPIDVSENDISLALNLEALGWGDEKAGGDTLMDVDAEEADSVSLQEKHILGSIVLIKAKRHDRRPCGRLPMIT